jgi:gamma-glutamyltranspeptidase/glutathione hydrolase
MFRQPALAATLEAIAQGGAKAFYRGEIAEKMLAFLKAEGAPFEADDFAQQQAVIYSPISSDYRGLTVYETAPPSQGFLVLEQLNILEGYDLSALKPFSAERMHLLVEAKKLAFEDRNRVAGDPAFVTWPLEQFISKGHAAVRRGEIDLERARVPQGALVAEHGGDTSYFAVADGEGNAVSFIHSLSASFGSGVVAGETGIVLNNRVGRGFVLEEGHPNVLAPGKRTMHTLNAFLVARDGRPWLVGGTPGGDQQTQWSTQVLTSVIDHGLSLQDAVDAPRWYSTPGTDPHSLDQPLTIRAESRLPATTLADLVTRGHVLEAVPPWAGGGAFQLVALDQARGVLRGATDPRAGGAALGV